MHERRGMFYGIIHAIAYYCIASHGLFFSLGYFLLQITNSNIYRSCHCVFMGQSKQKYR